MTWRALLLTAVIWTAFCSAIASGGHVIGALVGGAFALLVISMRLMIEADDRRSRRQRRERLRQRRKEGL